MHPVVSGCCRDTLKEEEKPCLSVPVCVALRGIQLRVAAAQISIGLRDLQLATSLALASVSLAWPLRNGDDREEHRDFVVLSWHGENLNEQ